MFLIIQSLLKGDYHALEFKLAIVAIMWSLPTIAMVIDLICGWNKAKQRGEARTSYGLRRTVTKAVMYFGLMFFALMFDCIGTFFYPLPYITMIASAFLVFIEGKSIFEKAHDKDKRKLNENLKDLTILLENKDDLVKGITEIVKKEISENKVNNEENSFEKLED